MKFSVNRDEDHSVTIGRVSGLASFHQERGNKVGVIWFDAHGAPHDAGVVHHQVHPKRSTREAKSMWCKLDGYKLNASRASARGFPISSWERRSGTGSRARLRR